MDLKEIQNLIKFVAKSGASEVKLEMKDVKITIKTEVTTLAQKWTMVPLGPSRLGIISVKEKDKSCQTKTENNATLTAAKNQCTCGKWSG